MLAAKDLAHRLSEFAIGGVSVREFEEWFVPSSWNAHVWAPQSLQDVAYSLELVLAEYSNGHVSNSYLRAFAGNVARELDASANTIPSSQVGVRMLAADVVSGRIAARPVLAAS